MSPKEYNKVSAAVRILHQKRDASARATHLMVKNDPLITYEKAFEGQAAIKKFFIATFLERKKMSTKTSFKRIALVAASALALAGFSAAPSQAGTVTAISVSKFTLGNDGLALGATKYTSAAGVATANGISSMTVTAGDTYTLVYQVVGTPSATDSITATLNGTLLHSTTGDTLTRAVEAGTGAISAAGDTYTRSLRNAGGGTGVAAFNTAPSVAGTYTINVELLNNAAAGGVKISTSVTLVVVAGSALSPSISTAYQEAPVATSVASATTNAVARSGSKTLNTNISQIAVTLKNADSTAHTKASVVTATMSGSGFVSVDAASALAPAAFNTRTSSNANTDADGLVFVHTQADGTAGTGTVTVSVTDVATLVTTVLGTFTITSYGSISALTVETKNHMVGQAGGGTTGLAAATSDTITYMPAFVIAAKDSAGQLANASAAPTIVSGTPTVVASGTCALDSDTTYGTGPVGYYGCSFTTAAGAKSGDKATLTVRIVDPADATKYLTTTVDVTVGGSTAKEVISFDKASYSAGEAMVVTITATDSSGNPVYDGAASPALTGSKQVGGSLPTASYYVAGKVATTAGALWAPAIGGDFTVVGTGTDTAETALSAVVSIDGDQSSSLALDAANAATDAANNAYDEAQNATQAASDALAAVTALAAQVKSLIASVKKLSAAVAKLKK